MSGIAVVFGRECHALQRLVDSLGSGSAGRGTAGVDRSGVEQAVDRPVEVVRAQVPGDMAGLVDGSVDEGLERLVLDAEVVIVDEVRVDRAGRLGGLWGAVVVAEVRRIGGSRISGRCWAANPCVVVVFLIRFRAGGGGVRG
ncbi:hypothetical protein ACLQ3K_24600 [Tsukamurella sp. DT100]|uniref:hypothetical protein n=1 Tax=Tsukamurella sp. DT100 TaxID=3393415 RepID=UPI003CE887A9